VETAALGPSLVLVATQRERAEADARSPRISRGLPSHAAALRAVSEWVVRDPQFA
jgi:hypothetical protein